MVAAFQATVHWIVERELTRTLDARVRIDRVRLSPFTATLHATDLTVRDKKNNQPLLRIQDLEVQALPGGLWQRELVVTRLRLLQPEAWIALTPDGFAWLPVGTEEPSGAPRLAITVKEVELRGGRIHVADRRRTPEHGETVEDLDVGLRDLSTREDRRESQTGLRLSGRWRGMAVSAEGWVAPFAARRGFHLPMRITHADLGRVAGLLPPGLAPAGLAGDAEVSVDVTGREAGGEWQVEAGLEVEASRVSARPRQDLAVQGRSLQLNGRGHWNPKVMGFSRLSLELARATIDLGGRWQVSVDRLAARGQADLDPKGLLVPEMVLEATGLNLGQAGQPPMVRIGRIAAAGGTDQRAGTARLERVSLTDMSVRATRQADGSLDMAEWVPAGPSAMTVGEGRPLYWEILGLDVERASLDLTDQAIRPERSLAIRDVSLRLAGATSDPKQPITFEATASTSVASAIKFSGTWVRDPMQLQAKADIQALDLPALRAWLPATFPLQVSSGQANLSLRTDARRGQDGGATHTLTAQGHAAIRGLQAQAPGYQLDSLGAQGARVEVSALTARFGPGGAGLDLRGKVSLTLAEGRTPGLASPTWKAAAVRMDIGQFQTAPWELHLRALEVDEPEVQAVRTGEGASTATNGLRGETLPAIRLDRLLVRNGRLGFRDEAVRPVWTGEFRQVDTVVEGLRTAGDVPASFRLSAEEAGGARVRLEGRVRPVTWTGEIHADVKDLDVLRPAPYLPDLARRVIRGGTGSGGMDLSLRRSGQALQITGKGEMVFSPLELGDAERQLTLLLADTVRVRVEHLSLDPPDVSLGAVELEQAWIGLGRDEDGSVPALRLANELRQSGTGGPALAGRTVERAGGAAPSLEVGVLTISDGTAEIEDRAVQPRFREQVRNLEVSVEGLTTVGDRKAGVTLTGELSDRSTVALHGFILPLPANLYVDLEGQVRDFNLHKANPYTTRVTSYRLQQGKLHTQVRYRIEQNRLDGDNLFRIDQLTLGEQVEPVDRFEALVGVPLALAVSLLQDSSGEIILRVPVHGELNNPEFDLGEAIQLAVKNTLIQLVSAPFRAIGNIFTLGGRIGAIEIDPVLFAPGSLALDELALAHLSNIAAVLRDRPTMKIKLSGMSHVDSDEDGLRAQKLEAELDRVAREPGVKGRDDALDRLFLRTFGAAAGNVTQQAKVSRLKAAQKVTAREIEDLPDARILSVYDHLAVAEGIERDRMFLAEGKLYRTAEGGGDWARRAEISILQP